MAGFFDVEFSLPAPILGVENPALEMYHQGQPLEMNDNPTKGPPVELRRSSSNNRDHRVVWSSAGIFIVVLHAVTAISLLLYLGTRQPSASILIAAALILFLSHIGITAGYHRLYAHRAYKLARPVEALLLFLGTLAIQGSVIRWSFDHRAHHRFVDRDGDPYCVHKGFWHAHVLWLFGEQPPLDGTVRDLFENPLVRFQSKYFALLALAGNFLVLALVGGILHDWLSAFVFVVLVRVVLSYHITWSINSLAHYWGSRSYSKELTARDNYLVALITVGEGYHNYHHTFPSDYRNGIRWFHVDPGKWIIWLLGKVGLASNLRSHSEPRIHRTLIRKDVNLLLKALHDVAEGAEELRHDLEARFGSISQLKAAIAQREASLNATLDEIVALTQRKRELIKSKAASAQHRALRASLRARTRALRSEWAEWCRLCGAILQT